MKVEGVEQYTRTNSIILSGVPVREREACGKSSADWLKKWR